MEEVNDLHRIASLSHDSSNVWKNQGMEIFSRSSRDEDEEDALKWAALEKLPTYKRVNFGILEEEEGGKHTQVNVKKLGPKDRKFIVDKLVKTAEVDNERFLLKLKDRIDRVGISLPTIEVRFENLNIEAEAYVGSRALPTVVNFCVNMMEGLLSFVHIFPSQKKTIQILHNVSGIIRPRRLTLLLGPPSSGKTTLLLALAGKLDPELKISGTVTYNGHEMHEFVPQRSSAYISQHDLHLGELTVRETLAFSSRCQGSGTRYELLTELLRREKEANIKPDPDIDIFMKSLTVKDQEMDVSTEYIIKILGLDVCADTLVGDDMIRGISGGQRKRVTTGEMLVGPNRALFMDEISTGLDSSTTFQIVNALKQSIHILEATAVISLLQPPPETYNLFDDIILLSEGQVVYQGPRENVLEFFKHMGFKCPERKGVADFLQEVTSKKDQEQYWANKDQPYSFISVKEFSDAFKSFHVGSKLRDDLAVPFDKDKGHAAALKTTKYGVSKWEVLKACTAREYLLMKRNAFVHFFKMAQLYLLAFIMMTLFLRTKMHKDNVIDGGLYMGALYFSTVAIMFNGLTELSLTVAKLPVFYKQRDLLFFPAWAYSIPSWILKIPLTVIQIIPWVCATYYVVGFDSDIERFFKQMLLFILMHQMALGLFRFMAGLGRDIVVASTFGSFVILAILVVGGFILSHDNIKPWWIWGYWISPLMYGQNGIAVNEFLGKSWSHVLAGSNETLGVMVLKSRAIRADASWYWIAIGTMIGYMFLFNFLFTLALTYLKPFKKHQMVVSDENTVEDEVSKSGELVYLSPKASEKNRKKGMALPFEPLSMTFEDLEYAVDMPPEMKAQGVKEDKLKLLKGVSGAFRPGVLTALMGVSGAGKTTLMDVLAGRKTGGYIEGTITISGYPKKQKAFARIAGYCEQYDIHSPHLTVLESLQYSAWLRLPQDLDNDARKMFVDEVMELVELTSLKDAIVGLPGVSGLSTEQRKRLTIAVELVANPSIIFMDEPTSGLDARAAAIVMRAVRNTVNTGRTVVCTIHQPSIDIFESFDELVLLKRGGEEIYIGPLGRQSAELIRYFEGIRGVSKIPDGYNPATWMLEMTSVAHEAVLGIDFAQYYKGSDLYRQNKALIKELSKPNPGSKELHFPTQYSQPFFTQFQACLWKQHWSYWRNPRYSAVRQLYTMFIAVMFGTIFWGLGSKRSRRQDLFNAMGSMYAAVLFIGIQNSTSVQPIVAVERTVFYRERAAGMYSALPYAFSQMVIELPYIFVQTVTYGIIVYAMIGFEWEVTKFFWYLFFMFFTLLYYTYYGMASVAVSPNYSISSVVSSAFYALWNLFSGFIIPKTRIPIWWRWFYYICPVAWTLYGLVTSQFGDVKDELEDVGVSVETFIRDYFDFRHEFLGYVAVIVVGIAALFGFIFAFSIKKFNFQKR